MKKEIAEKAAKWWADFLRDGAPLDNGDNSETGAMAMAPAMLVQGEEAKNRDIADADKFECALSQILQDMDDTKHLTLSVDYGPDYILSHAAEKAGIVLGMTSLPWKTVMSFRGGSIEVAVGYGAPLEILGDAP